MTDDASAPAGSRHDKSANDVRCWDCATRATERLEEMFVALIQRRRIANGQSPALRTVFLKQHGVATGSLEPLPDLAADLKVGVFAHGPLPLCMRFSSDAQPTDPDLKTTLGVGIKVFSVPGPKLLGDGDTADFVMQNHDVFFVDTAQEFCEFTTAGVVDGDYPAWLRRHPKTARILDEMAKVEASCLSAGYWAILPFAFGTDATGAPRHVKYRLEPVGQPAGEPFDDPDYLRLDLARRLRQGPARFRVLIQFRTDPATMPLDRATVRWDSPWIHVADVVLPQQDVERRGMGAFGENLAFNIWRTPPEQEPQGSLAAARRVVYQGSADQRRVANGVPLVEPQAPAPTPADRGPASDADDCIVSAAIYPPIGVCRVGNSPDGLFVGPEVPEPLPLPPGSHRDAEGRLKRQAARFRIYGLNALGVAVRELTADDAEITWSVAVANQKAAWYEFQLALDIPEAASAPPSLLRNPTVGDRTRLVIAPRERRITGVNRSGNDHRFDDGQFLGKPVYLGELRTDERGRLLVLGGHGVSASPDGTRAWTFANNDGWHDDTADGPVTATVTYQGVALRVAPAWVVVAPPNYGPQLKSVRTMWDLMRDVAIGSGMLARPARPSFARDIRPLFERLGALQWVNQGFAAAFGHGQPFDFSSPAWLARLGDPSPANLETRRTLANSFRDFDVDAWSPVPWPWVYGDAMAVPAAHTPRQMTELTATQRRMLEQWVCGDFDADHDPDREPPRRVEDVPIEDQPDALTRAAMEFCLADAFHPGCEMTWPMRQAGLYASAFRVRHRKASRPPPRDYGARLDATALSLPDGPILGGQSPGSITRWMAVPWQTDTASCRSGYDKSFDPYLPTFWPARVPNQVLAPENYRVVMDEQRPREERRQAFAQRANWFAPLQPGTKNYTDQLDHMIHHFDRMGVVEVRPGLPDDPDFPTVIQVSDDGAAQPLAGAAASGTADGVDPATVARLARRLQADARPPRENDAAGDLSTIDKVRRFPNGLTRR